MEKFTNWRDKGTGIAPFLPTPPPISQENGVKAFFNGLKLSLKLILILPIILVAVVAKWTPVSRPLWKLAAILLCNWDVQVSVDGVKRRDQRSKHLPSKGQIYVVNYSSPLDCFVLWFISQGSIALCIPINDGKTVSMHQLSMLEFVSFTLNGSLWESGNPAHRIVKNVEELKNQVCYVFAEGTTSNGKSVLPFSITQDFWDSFLDVNAAGSSSSSKTQVSKSSATQRQVQVINLKINSSLTTPLSVGKWRYLLRVSTQGVSYKCKISDRFQPNLEKMRIALCGGDKFKLVGKELNADSKRKFAAKYGSRKR